MGVAPPTKTGGYDEFVRSIAKAMSLLGHVVGFGIFLFTFALVAIEVVLNPIFLFAQAKSNGVETGTPFTSFSWWIVVLITFATTGIQYALLQPGGDRKSLGYKVGWVIAIMDTAMDGGGFMAWVNGGDVWKLSGDSSNLQLGIFPPAGSGWEQWVGYVVICGVCLFHEPFLSVVLGRLTFTPAPGSGGAVVNVSRWTERAGKLHNRVKIVAISFAPYILLGLDMLLFPQSVKGEGGLIQTVWFILTVFVTLLAIVTWEYYNHLRDGGYKLRDLDGKHKAIFLSALGITILDSTFDLMGFNKMIFGEATLLPVSLHNSLPFFLTAGMVMVMCTAFEAMNSQLFGPLSRLADAGGPDLLPSMGGEIDMSYGGGDDKGSPFAGFADDDLGPQA